MCWEELADEGVGDIRANLGGYDLRGWNLGRLIYPRKWEDFHKDIVQSLSWTYQLNLP